MPRSTRPRRRMPSGSKRPPSAVQVQQTFAPIFGFLATLRTGEVWCTDSGSPVMPVWGGELYEACPALDGWISCWQRIVEGERLAIDLSPLAVVHDRLQAGVPLTVEMVEAARRCTYACRRAYSGLPRERARSYSLTELIAVEVEACGLAQSSERSERGRPYGLPHGKGE